MRPNDPPIPTLPGNLKRLRKQKKMTQGRLAALIGKRYLAIYEFETGRRNPSLDTVAQMASALGCDPADIVRINPKSA